MYSIQHKRNELKTAKNIIIILFFLRIIHEYFQPKNGRKIRIFSLGRKNNILLVKRGYLSNLKGPGGKNVNESILKLKYMHSGDRLLYI